jgi:rhodanese-related sulfurtransferase
MGTTLETGQEPTYLSQYMKIETVSAKKLPAFFANDYTVIDVRTPSEFKSAHVVGAESLPLDQLDAEQFCGKYGDGSPVYILCQSGKRATIAAERLVKAGHQNVTVIEGGTTAAMDADIDMKYGKGSISIERQVRIAAGALVFLGTLLGLFVHGGFFGISAFVGAGLFFAGVTDTCGMGMMLAKCPWNQ